MSDDGSGNGLAKKLTRGAAKGALAGGVGGIVGGPPAIAAGAAAGALLGAGKELVGAAIDMYKSPTEKMRIEHGLALARDLEMVGALSRNQERLEQAVDRLREKLGDQEALVTALLARLQALETAWKTSADSRKADIVMEAFVRSFDPDAYDSGISTRLITIIGQLEYPEIKFLRDEFTPDGGLGLWVRVVEETGKNRGDHKVTTRVRKLARPGTEIGEILARLHEHRLVHNHQNFESSPHLTSRSWLGTQLVAHIESHEDEDVGSGEEE